MGSDVTADDLWPLVARLSKDQQLKLARRALLAAGGAATDAEAYRLAPPVADEFATDEEGGAWEAAGWDEFRAPR